MLGSSTGSNIRSVKMVDNIVYKTTIDIYLPVDSDPEVQFSALKASKIEIMINYPNTLVMCMSRAALTSGRNGRLQKIFRVTTIKDLHKDSYNRKKQPKFEVEFSGPWHNLLSTEEVCIKIIPACDFLVLIILHPYHTAEEYQKIAS